MLPSKANSDATVWQVTSQAAAQQARVDGATAAPQNPAAQPNGSAPAMQRRLIARFPFHAVLRRREPAAAHARYYHSFGGSGNWVRPGQEHTKATNVWHSDDNYVLEPPWVSTLRAIKLPSAGGDTLFSDMGQAFADLSTETQALLCGKRMIADWQQVWYFVVACVWS